MNFTLKQLRVFCTVYELRSFTAAARAVFLTQSAVSKLCAELEAEIGQPLFERTTRAVVPCEGAADFYAHAQDILSAVRAAEQGLDEVHSLKRGAVGIAAAPMMMYGLLMDSIATYHRAHPGVRLDLYELTTDDTLDQVRRGRADLGIVSAEAPGSDLSSRVIYRDSMFAVCPAGHVLASRRHLNWADLTAHDWIALHGDYGVRRSADRISAALDLDWQPDIEAGMLSSVFGMVAAGLGITVAPGYACGLARQLGLAVLPLHELGEHRHVLRLVQRAKSKPSIAALAFIEALSAQLREREQQASGIDAR